MERGEARAAIDDQRRALVHLPEDLSEREWRQPSPCERWAVRQVAAHLALQDTTWPAMPRVMLDIIRPGGHEQRDPREGLPSCRAALGGHDRPDPRPDRGMAAAAGRHLP